MPECYVCDAPAAGICDACFFFIYCGPACQRAHWAEHLPVCDAIRLDTATVLEPHGPDFYPNPPNCHACGVALNNRVSLCSGCEFAGYCSEVCQQEHWEREHSDVCAFVREAKDARRARDERLRASAAAAAAEAAEAERTRKHALRRAHVSLDVGRFSVIETVGALRDFPEDAGLAVKALTAFENRFDEQAAVDAGAVAAVIAAMRAHAGVSGVAHRGCRALLNIASIPAGALAAIDAGAPTAVVAAMRAHAGVSGVAQYGCWALLNIAFLPAGQQAAIDAGAPAAIVASMRVQVNVSEVAMFGCEALHCISFSPAGKAAVVAAGGREAITAAGVQFASAKNISERALSRLAQA